MTKAYDKIMAGLNEALEIAKGNAHPVGVYVPAGAAGNDYDIRVRQLAAEDGGGFLAWVPELPGCVSDGNTPDEAIENVTLAIGEWIDEAVRLGRVVPTPAPR